MSASSKRRRQRRAEEAAKRRPADGTAAQTPAASAPQKDTSPVVTRAPAPASAGTARAGGAGGAGAARAAGATALLETPSNADTTDETTPSTTSTPRTPSTTTKRRRGAAVAAALTLAITAGYVVVSGSFTFPDSPANAAVNDGFAPYFAQRWDVFAPTMQKVNTGLSIQVQWRDGTGELVHSDWVDVTGMELQAVNGPVPSRITKDTANAVSTYLDRFDQLTEAQQERVTDTFIQRDPDGGFEPIPDDQLVDDVQSLFRAGDKTGDGTAATSDATIPFIRYDYMLTRFAAAFGQAYFGEQIERVRWRIDYQRPNDFDHRNDQTPQYSPSETDFGWRQPAEAPDPETVAVFADVIERYSR